MGFLDLFKPKWKHSNADVRAEAVKQMSADDLAILAQVVRQDPDARIRRIALKKIEDPGVLDEVADSDTDEALRKDAAEKASTLLLDSACAADEASAKSALSRIRSVKALAEVARRAQAETVRRGALERIDDPKALAEVARKANDAQIRRMAVERVDEENVLREVAIGDGVKEVGLAAVAKLGDLQSLENVAKKCKMKAVKSAAKERIQALKDAQPKVGGLSAEKRKSKLALIARTVEEAAADDDLAHAAAAIELAQRELAELGHHPGDEPFEKRVEKAISKYKLRKEEIGARDRAKAALEARRAKENEEQHKRDAEERAHDEERAAEDAKLKAIADEARKVEDERRAVERARRAEEKAKRDAEKAQRDAEKAEARARKEAEADENLRRLEEVVARLESLDGSDDKKSIEQALKNAQDVVKAGALPRDKGDAVRDKYEAIRQKLVVKLAELKDTEDWKRWSNVPKLEALCGKMEALLASIHAETDRAPISAELKKLQAEWKTVGAAPKEKSEALWKRFKAASDQVWELCKAQFEKDDASKGENLKLKEALVARVAELAAVADDQINWKDTADKIKAIQEEWKQIGATARAEGETVWRSFREACDKFFDRRKAHFVEMDASKEENAKKQDELIAEAEAIAAIPLESINWKDSAETLKSLQAAWKDVGPSGKDKQEANWQRFRGACDKFFDARKLHFDKLDEERAGNLKKKELLCEKVDALKDADDVEAALAEVKKLQAEWKTVGPAPKEQADAIWERFKSACDLIYDRTRAPEPNKAPEPAATGKPPQAEGVSGFSNKLPLAGVAEKLAAATSGWEEAASGWEDIAATIEPKKDDKK
jgi:hypothetical protein